MPEENKKYRIFEKFPDAGLVYSFSSRASGNMSLCYGDTKDSLENRKLFLKALGIDYQRLVCAKQVHGKTVRYMGEDDKGRGALSGDTAIPDTDALVTDKKNLPLAILTADCLPVFLYDPKTPAIGLAHAGWRSTSFNISGETVKLMRERFHTDAGNFLVGFGPVIRSCCYEVKEELSGFSPCEFIKRGQRYYLDLAVINRKQLLGSGVKEENIFDCGICTVCHNKDFFSYRLEQGSSGRMMSVMMLKD
ncbi:MAG: peptidoglycan editing factor PgeF [Candidatus Omnitrophica bacterium]|nr:peptidoglycan editing factor PgeF [Candidatus Omnitrophota bacterium]MDD5592910.1 peptidoglycan editing factor PgeF [Candidatus Omnitrophota bacterium]